LECFTIGLNHCDDQFPAKDMENATSASRDTIRVFIAGSGQKMVIPPGVRAVGARFGRWLDRFDGYVSRQPTPESPHGWKSAIASS